MSLRLKTAPTAEPVTLAEAKSHLRVTDADSDTYITSLITVARQHVEEYTSRALITQTWEQRLDAFPPASAKIALARPPLVSVSSVAYVDTDGIAQVLAGAEYTVDIYDEPARLVPAYGKTWPSTRSVPNAVTVEFVAGYGNAAAVPLAIRQAMLLALGELYEHRALSLVGATVAPLPLSAQALLAPYRILHI